MHASVSKMTKPGSLADKMIGVWAACVRQITTWMDQVLHPRSIAPSTSEGRDGGGSNGKVGAH